MRIAVEREFEGVGNQIENDLLPHLTVDIDRLVERRAVDHQGQTRGLTDRSEVAGKIDSKHRQIGRLVRSLHPAGFNAREIEQRIDQLEQAQ